MIWAGALCLLSGVGLTLGALGLAPWLLNPMAWGHVGLSVAVLLIGAFWWVRHYRCHGRVGRAAQRGSGWCQTALWIVVLLSGLFFFPVMGSAKGTLIFRWAHGLLALAAVVFFFLHTRRWIPRS